MPPFRAGLRKRKILPEESNQSSNNVQKEEEPQSDSEDNVDYLADLNLEGDETDSEHEAESNAGSDGELDEVLFGDDADSTLGDDEQSGKASDESSDLTDSEDDDSDAGSDKKDDSDGDDDDGGSEKPGSDDDDDGDDDDDDDDGEAEMIHEAEREASKTGVDSDAESGIGQTQSSSSESDRIPPHRPKREPKKDSKDDEKKPKSNIDKFADAVNKSNNKPPVEKKDEYESGDTSDEEDRVNTVGDIPMWWYNEYPHIGYDLDGRRIMKPPQRDQIDEFLKKCEDPDFWRTVRDPATGQDVLLAPRDLALLQRLRAARPPDAAHDQHEPWVEWFTREVLATPLRAFPEHKRSFLPSRSEQQQISRIVHALKMGWTKTRKEIADERRKKKEKHFYNLWGSTTAEEEEKLRGIHKHIPAPKRPLPSHAESYNPPPEYLLDAKEMKEWDKLSSTPWKRKYTFLPTRHASLRAVPAYPRYTRERFLRCLDLYLAPRAIKMRLTISPDDLVPKLPSPRDLQPFPTGEALVMRGHAALVRSVDFDPSGQYIVSGSDDGTVKVWETSSGRCVRTLALGAGAGVAAARWVPVAGLSLLAAAAGARLLLLNPGAGVGAHRVAAATDALLDAPPPDHTRAMDERTASCVKWDHVTPEEWAKGIRIAITHFKPIIHVAWHARGDYVCVCVREGQSRSVVVHQLSRRRSQLPFTRAAGLVQCAQFHPSRPLLFVATQRAVRVYDLLRQTLLRKLAPGAQWLSAMALHPAGDNLLLASYDRKCMWFDLELSAKPYQTLRLHGGAVRAVDFHRRYPLFASAGDDPRVVVSHGMVYNDLLQNPLLVPLKQLRGPEVRDSLCALDVRWHPTQPWLLVAGADGTLRLYS